MKKEFPGNLIGLPPSRIIKKTSEEDAFFLALSLIYNDLKGVMLFHNLLYENYREPGSDEISPHSGEFGGVRSQITRLMIGIVSEFLVFLEKNKSIICTVNFKHYFERQLPSDIFSMWDSIKKIAFRSELGSSGELFSLLARIRSNIIFHYDHKGTELIKGYAIHFFKQEKFVHNEEAYFSVGKNMRETRFYYADAAVAGYMKKELEIDLNSWKEFKELVDKMNAVMVGLISLWVCAK